MFVSTCFANYFIQFRIEQYIQLQENADNINDNAYNTCTLSVYVPVYE